MDTRHKPRHRRSRRRRLGQHFLTGRTALEQVVEAIEPLPGQQILEVGPGRGALTVPLVSSGACVLAVELDPVLVRRLREKQNLRGFMVVEGDILKVDLRELVVGHFPERHPVRVIGNLPYSVASPTLLRLLPRADLFSDWTLMVQREVADRILAVPGSRLFGVMTLLCACHAAPRRLLDLAPSCFSPPPEVHSTLIHFVPRPLPFTAEAQWTAFQRVVKAAFSSRRKMFRNTLATGLRIGVDQAEAALTAAGLNPEDRPERIPLEGYVELTRQLASST